MTNLSQATAAPTELRINGDVYRIKPLRDRDYGELEQWLRSKAMDAARENLNGFSGEDRRTLLSLAYDKASRMSVTSPDAMEILLSREGAARLVWLGVRQEHPDVKLEQVGAWLSDPKVLEDAMGRFDDVNELAKAGGPSKKSRTGRARRPSTAAPSTDTSASGTVSVPPPSPT